jgi:hypothetical protein
MRFGGARRLPPGSGRNDLRQLASALLWLHRNGMDALVQRRSKAWHDRDGKAHLP